MTEWTKRNPRLEYCPCWSGPMLSFSEKAARYAVYVHDIVLTELCIASANILEVNFRGSPHIVETWLI